MYELKNALSMPNKSTLLIGLFATLVAYSLIWKLRSNPNPPQEANNTIQSTPAQNPESMEYVTVEPDGDSTSYLWSVDANGQRGASFNYESGVLEILTLEPGSWDQPVVEKYSTAFEPDFVAGSWNDFVLGGWAKGDFVLERWELKPVEGAYEGLIPTSPAPKIGESASVSWPSSGWVGAYLAPSERSMRLPPKRVEVLRGQVGSVDALYVDGWMRFVLVASAVDGIVHMIKLSESPSMDVFLSVADIPWLANPALKPRFYIFFPAGTNEVKYCVWADGDYASEPDAYIASDFDNDGVLDNLESVTGGFLALTTMFPIRSGRRPEKTYR